MIKLPQQCRAVIFDKDGTLYTMSHMNRYCLSKLMKAIRIISPELDNSTRFQIYERGTRYIQSHPWKTVIAQMSVEWSHASKIPFDRTRYILETVLPDDSWRIQRQIIPLHPFLSGLKTSGLKVALYTEDNNHATHCLLVRDRIRDLFDVILCGNDPHGTKDGTDGINHILSEIGVRSNETCIVGDSERDIQLAHNNSLLASYGIGDVKGATCNIESVALLST